MRERTADSFVIFTLALRLSSCRFSLRSEKEAQKKKRAVVKHLVRQTSVFLLYSVFLFNALEINVEKIFPQSNPENGVYL